MLIKLAFALLTLTLMAAAYRYVMSGLSRARVPSRKRAVTLRYDARHGVWRQ